MILLTALFRLGDRRDPLYDVKLTEEHITLTQVNDKADNPVQADNCVQVTTLADVVGVRLYRDYRSPGACLHIYSYERRKPRWGKEDRSRTELRFFIGSEESQDGNMEIGGTWKCAVLSIVRGYPFDPGW